MCRLPYRRGMGGPADCRRRGALLCSRSRFYLLIGRWRLDYGYRAARHADGTILLVSDPDRPHLSRTSNMNRLGDRPNRALSLGANVVCVDFDADGGELRRIYVRERTE